MELLFLTHKYVLILKIRKPASDKRNSGTFLAMTATITDIYRYPVKGLSAQLLEETSLEPGETIPADRAYALARATTIFDPANPEWLPKTHFLMLMRDEKLAELRTSFDEGRQELRLDTADGELGAASLNTADGRHVLESLIAEYLGLPGDQWPRIVEAPGFSFSDHSNKVISIINLATVREVSEAVGQEVDPLRFRGNIYVDDLPAWGEFDWVEKTISIGDAELAITKRTERCAATNVDPRTGARDMNIPRTLTKSFGHYDVGVYARVETGGHVAVGDSIHLLD